VVTANYETFNYVIFAVPVTSSLLYTAFLLGNYSEALSVSDPPSEGIR